MDLGSTMGSPVESAPVDSMCQPSSPGAALTGKRIGKVPIPLRWYPAVSTRELVERSVQALGISGGDKWRVCACSHADHRPFPCSSVMLVAVGRLPEQFPTLVAQITRESTPQQDGTITNKAVHVKVRQSSTWQTTR